MRSLAKPRDDRNAEEMPALYSERSEESPCDSHLRQRRFLAVLELTDATVVQRHPRGTRKGNFRRGVPTPSFVGTCPMGEARPEGYR